MAIALAKDRRECPLIGQLKNQNTTDHINQSCQDTKEEVLENFGSHEGSEFS